jgi:two-component system sensor kinase FixL
LFVELEGYAVIIIDTTGNIMSWNAGAQLIYGYSLAEIIEKHISIFYTHDQIAKGQPWCNLKTARDDGRFETEEWKYKKNGTAFHAHTIITAMYNIEGKLRGFGIISRDITIQKALETENKLLREQLEQSSFKKNEITK